MATFIFLPFPESATRKQSAPWIGIFAVIGTACEAAASPQAAHRAGFAHRIRFGDAT
jgi:hypothetical protein